MTLPRTPHMILHVGAPKCGSSALQTALSAAPDLRSADGTKYRYTGLYKPANAWRSLEGVQLTQAAQRSRYGYVSWPNLGRDAVRGPEVFAALQQVVLKGRKRGHVPILSSEGWINHAEAFGDVLADLGNPPVDVVVFLRPVVDWVNAAFWQWGVWHTPNLDTWMKRGNMPYSFADDIAAWSRIPNVRLIVRSQRPDVVAKFAAMYYLPLQAERQANTASSAILTGVLLRNRVFRPSGHEGAVEFIVQRWCPPVPGRKLWAVFARHIHALRPVRDATLETLHAVLPADDLEDLLVDPRWVREGAYHADVLAGLTNLKDPDAFAPLFEALCQGVNAASAAAGVVPPVVPSCPPVGADVATWDAAICPVLDALIQADLKVRQKTVPRWQQPVFGMLSRLQGR